MANETAAGQDGWILAGGRKMYQVYKYERQEAMLYWYGLRPEDNRGTCRDLIDVRELPAKYYVVPVMERQPDRWLFDDRDAFLEECRRARREAVENHAVIFAAALADGFDLEAHMERLIRLKYQPAKDGPVDKFLEAHM